MYVEELMTKQIHCCAPEDSLQQAAQLMWEHDCGCLPVCSVSAREGSQTVGVLTDRDICMAALLHGKSLRELSVNQAMTKDVLSCQPADTLDHVERIMRGAQIRRVPVLDETKSLVGMISLADLAREAARERTETHQEITETEIGDTLAAICESTSPPTLART